MTPPSSATLDELIDAGEPGSPENAEVLELARVLSETTARRSAYLVSPDDERLKIPRGVYRILVRAVEELARGNAVSIVPVQHELTTQQAADILGVSRPHLIKLLDREHIPYHLVGTHRRIRIDDLMRYRDARSTHRRELLRQLAEENERLGLKG